MSFITKFLLFGIVSAVLAFYLCPWLIQEPEIPKIPAKQWWGRGKLPLEESKIPVDNEKIVPFKVNIPDNVINDLKERLLNTRFNEPLEGVQFQYGFNGNYLKEVVKYWTTTYNWKKQQDYLNKFEQFTTQIEGLNVHFLHVKPKVTPKDKVRVLPLMLIHGWPGSVLEFYKMIPMLTTPKDGVVFEIICPSIPGYGFSEAPHHPGFSVPATARLFAKLMKRLGHEKFYVHGGDFGSIISTAMSIYYSERIHGLHITMTTTTTDPRGFVKMLIGSWFPSLILDAGEKTNIFPLSKFFSTLLRESGYMHIQATKPDTVGSALSDSPAGLAAYILEKFIMWTEESFIDLADGGITKKYTMDELLTNVMIYWVTNSITSSQRFYKENFSSNEAFQTDRISVKVPSAVAVFPNEIVVNPRSIAKHKFANLISYNAMPRGGHFAAFEEPQLLADDIWKFVTTVETLKNVKK